MTNPSSAQVLADLAQDFATELDLHYEVADRALIIESLRHIITAVEILREEGHAVPEACIHILRRFNASPNLQ